MVEAPSTPPFMVTKGFRAKQNMATRSILCRLCEEMPAALGMSCRVHSPGGWAQGR